MTDMRKKPLNTVKDVVDALGGPTFLGDQLGIGQNAVSNWKIRNQIPSGWHLRVYLGVRQVGMEVDPSVFGLESLAALEPPPGKRKRRPQATARAA